jgi:bacillithiol system protein YtxJ
MPRAVRAAPAVLARGKPAGIIFLSPMTNLTHLSDLDMLEAAIAESLQRPVLLFKHSRTCGISCEALDQLHSHLDRAAGDLACKMITVQSHRRVSDNAAERLGVRHETPQAILLRDGRVVWKASHFRITADELARAVADS